MTCWRIVNRKRSEMEVSAQIVLLIPRWVKFPVKTLTKYWCVHMGILSIQAYKLLCMCGFWSKTKTPLPQKSIYIYIWIKRLHKILDKDSAAAPKILLCSGRWWAHKLMLALPNFHLTRLGSSVRQHIQCWNLLFNGAALSLPNKWAFSLWRKRQKCTYQTRIFQIKPFALSGKIF